VYHFIFFITLRDVISSERSKRCINPINSFYGARFGNLSRIKNERIAITSANRSKSQKPLTRRRGKKNGEKSKLRSNLILPEGVKTNFRY
jgi:hypothetical protein